MTRKEFIEILNKPGNFTFETGKNEGLVGVTPESILIWVDEKGFSLASDDMDEEKEPRNVNTYRNATELLETFKVDGKPFSTSVLPQIQELRQMFYG